MSFYWFDYETFGTHPAYDRPAQFAGVRTDDSLRPVGDPLLVYCKPANDFLPDPEACIITGITPDICIDKGIPEAEFIRTIHDEMSKPGTCNVGYNNLRFDDEFTRHTLFRNFFDPYEQEWKNGNSRWDLLDIVRMTRALRPDGIEWPVHSDGSINNTLQAITSLNGIEHTHAHDALSDVYATIAVARLLRERKKRLFDFAFENRDKHSAAALLNLREQKMVLHVSGMIPGDYLHTALILPLTKHPSNKNGILVYDLRVDPRPFLDLEPEELALRQFSPKSELPDDMPRLPVKTVHLNRCPVLAPAATLDKAAQQRTRISPEQSEKHAKILRKHPAFAKNVQLASAEQSFQDSPDVDGSLYSGGFFTESDKRAFEKIRNTLPDKLANLDLFYDDRRIPEMLFRYRARNFPETLDAGETAEWNMQRHKRLRDYRPTGYEAGDYLDKLRLLQEALPQHSELLDRLRAYALDVLAP
ncbi:MAG: exodeoxyribonuclease I [Gammaproteobacteria bacterium]|nr:exodeoxyribonuclease I [Gammaproteobacteria bacterium]